MRTQITGFIFFHLLLSACYQVPQPKISTSIRPVPPASVKNPGHRDTLQFLNFDGNTDYWYAVFLNREKDTVQLVSDTTLTDQLLGKLTEVDWKTDTLYEAGDDNRPYLAKRLLSFKPVKGKAFTPHLSPRQALETVRQLDVVRSGADKSWISEMPTADNRYYQVETATNADGHNSRFKTFRVYFYPFYEIKVYNDSEDKELSLTEWLRQR